jgi:hypothetical protein
VPTHRQSVHSGHPQEPAAEVVAARDPVALRAYELYQERGCAPGRELEDWLRAEHEVEEASTRSRT